MNNFSPENSTNKDLVAETENSVFLDENNTEKIEDSIKPLDEINIDHDTLYEWYSTAMQRREREPLEQERFERHFFEGASLDTPMGYGNKNDGYLLGGIRQNIFIPTHFAPKTIRGGYNLFKNLGESNNVSAVVAITEDLAETLVKLPSWKKLDFTIPANFRDELASKIIMYNSNPETEKNLMSLAAEFIQEYKNKMYEHEDQDNNEVEEEKEYENVVLDRRNGNIIRQRY